MTALFHKTCNEETKVNFEGTSLTLVYISGKCEFIHQVHGKGPAIEQ